MLLYITFVILRQAEFNRHRAFAPIALCWGQEVRHGMHVLPAAEQPASELQLRPAGDLPRVPEVLAAVTRSGSRPTTTHRTGAATRPSWTSRTADPSGRWCSRRTPRPVASGAAAACRPSTPSPSSVRTSATSIPGRPRRPRPRRRSTTGSRSSSAPGGSTRSPGARSASSASAGWGRSSVSGSHLGVGHIVGIDFDVLEPSNRPRVVGATPRDVGEPLIRSWFSPLRWLGRRLVRHKVDVARRVARQANPAVRYDAVVGDVNDLHTARLRQGRRSLAVGRPPRYRGARFPLPFATCRVSAE